MCIRDRLMVLGGLGSALISLAIPFTNSFNALVILWGLNGFLQSAGWPSLVKLASYALRSGYMSRGYALVSTSWSLGHALVWLLSIEVVLRFGWRTCFLLNGGALVLVTLFSASLLVRVPTEASGQKHGERTLLLRTTVLYISLVSVMHCLAYGARYLLINYLPSFLEVTGGTGSMHYSVLLPLAGAAGMVMYAPLFDRVGAGRRPLLVGVMGLAGSASLWLFPRVYGLWEVLGLLILVVLSTLLYGLETQLTTTIPLAASGRRYSSLVAGIVDASGSLGAAIAGIVGGEAMQRGSFEEAAFVWSLALLTLLPLSLLASRLLQGPEEVDAHSGRQRQE